MDDAPARRFQVTLERPPAATVELIATDAAGNQHRLPVVVPTAYPADTRAATSPAGWSSPRGRRPFLALVDRGVINTVQLDIKDERVDRLRLAGAAGPPERGGASLLRAYAAIEELHRRGVRVIGRIVAFRDPVLADWAWASGNRTWVLQHPDGSRLDAYGGFTNYAEPAVRRYNLDLAVEAAGLGFDEILWDYVRRPEGDPSEMVVPGLTGTERTTGDVMVQFLEEARAELRPLGVYQGASVFGIAATRPENIGQPVDRMAAVVDYVAPMVYPSHYVPGECGVADPNGDPYAIVRCSLQDFNQVMAGHPAVLVPWLQDFSLDGYTYGAAEVAAQVRAAGEVGARSSVVEPEGVLHLRRSFVTERSRVGAPGGASLSRPGSLR
ncbi:MAG: putative glycoside hydrolase [Acidimicrobiales bacterium]